MERVASYLVFVIALGSVLNVFCQDELYKRLVCVDKTDCNSCHRAAEFCHWCEDLSFNEKNNFPSCNVKTSLLDDGCPVDAILAPKRTRSFITEDESFSDMTSEDINSANQIKPQRISIELKPGETRTITFEYRLAKNYPLDLYYLMDLTWSMRDDKETLVGLKLDLPAALKNLTNNFRLGFGSFADKPLMPYTAMDERHRKNPCAAEFSTCESTYTYRHGLSLTSKVSDFVAVVNKTEVTANLDNTEAGMEALMQVVMCKDDIGWSNDSRKIVILATDGLVHFAGFGKLGGVVKPNDEKCHLDEIGSYTESTKMDYPSLAQIHRILKENSVNVIFAVTESVKTSYDKIHELLPESTYIGRLEEDSSNILNLVRQGYEDFVSTISFRDDSEGPIKLTYFSDCGANGSIVETSKCEDVKISQTYQFTVNISMDECPKDGHGKTKTIKISEAQIGRQALTLEIELFCNCDCNAPTSPELEIPRCPNNGELVCGKCRCLKGWSGPNCDCNIDNSGSDGALLAKRCIGHDGGPPCSGTGDCLCGVCMCDRGYTGTFCQCMECDKDPSNGLECGGPGHGVCSCGQCACSAGRGGPACSCPLSTERCVLPGDSVACSGRGVCNCGECQCSREEGLSYTGKFCETCASCNNTVCLLYEGCARAAALRASTSAACASPSGTLFIPTLVEDYIQPPSNASLCIVRVVEEGTNYCDYPFTYEVQRDWTVLLMLYPKTCVSFLRNAMFGGLVTFLCSLAMGLLFICVWKVYQVTTEKRLYAKFAAERDMHMKALGHTQQNPLYRSPISEFTLPDNFNRVKKD